MITRYQSLFGDRVSNEDIQNYTRVHKSIVKGNMSSVGVCLDTPDKITIPLKLHQQRMVAEMMCKEDSEHRFSSGINMGVISDKVGSGKSLVVLSLIAARQRVLKTIPNHMVSDHSIPYQAYPYRYRTTRYQSSFTWNDFAGFELEPTQEFPTNLVVVPHNVFNQWKGYLDRHTKLSYKPLGSVYDLRNLDLDKLGEYQVILVKSTKFDDFMRMVYAKFPGKVDTITTQTDPKIQVFRKLQFKMNRPERLLYTSIGGSFLQDMLTLDAFCKDVTIHSVKRLIPLLKDRKPLECLFYYLFGVNIEQLELMIKHSDPKFIYDSFLQSLSNYNSRISKMRTELHAHINKIQYVRHMIQNRDYSEDTMVSALETLEASIQSIPPVNFKNLHSSIQANLSTEITQHRRIMGMLSRHARRFMSTYDVSRLKACLDGNARPLFQMVKYKGPIFQRIIIDEANSIKLSQVQYRQQTAYAKFTWFVTSSVEELLNPNGRHVNGKWINGIPRQGYVHDIFLNNVHPSRHVFLEQMFHKNSDECVDASFRLPQPLSHVVNCLTPPEIGILQGLGLPKVIRALNAGDMATAIQTAGCTERSEKDIVKRILGKFSDKLLKLDTRLNKHQMKLNGMHSGVAEEQPKRLTPSEKKRSEEAIEKILCQKKELEGKLEALRMRISNTSNHDCPICMDRIGKPALVPCCHHLFCFSCIANALNAKSNCPLCRTPLAVDSLLIYKQQENDNEEEPEPPKIQLPTKIKATVDLILNKPDGKFLVFSEFHNSFNKLKEAFQKNHISCRELKGNAGQIRNTLKKYEDGSCRVLLLNARFYGSGLNLQMTTDIIIGHRMSRDLELQIIGRGQRLGRTDALHVHYLCYNSEYGTVPGQQVSN